jgi:hypothetical protein
VAEGRDEIEITAEMISAGVNVACLYDMRQDNWAEVVREVYAEMRALEGRLHPLGDVSGAKSLNSVLAPTKHYGLNQARLRDESLAIALRTILD